MPYLFLEMGVGFVLFVFHMGGFLPVRLSGFRIDLVFHKALVPCGFQFGLLFLLCDIQAVIFVQNDRGILDNAQHREFTEWLYNYLWFSKGTSDFSNMKLTSMYPVASGHFNNWIFIFWSTSANSYHSTLHSTPSTHHISLTPHSWALTRQSPPHKDPSTSPNLYLLLQILFIPLIINEGQWQYQSLLKLGYPIYILHYLCFRFMILWISHDVLLFQSTLELKRTPLSIFTEWMKAVTK